MGGGGKGDVNRPGIVMFPAFAGVGMFAGERGSTIE